MHDREDPDPGGILALALTEAEWKPAVVEAAAEPVLAPSTMARRVTAA